MGISRLTAKNLVYKKIFVDTVDKISFLKVKNNSVFYLIFKEIFVFREIYPQELGL